ncbi:MAG: WD40 repeat protein [Maribacter sp.]|jgi:WD40 repeat protein
MPNISTFLELWKEESHTHPNFSNYFIRPTRSFASAPVSLNDGGAAHSNFIGGLIANDEYVFTSSEDGSLSVWTGEDMDEIITIYPSSCINQMALSPNGKYLAGACDDYTAKVYELPSMELVHSLELHDGYVSKVGFSQQGHLVSISKDGTVGVWDYENGRLLHHLKGHDDWVYSLAIHPTKPLVITGSLNSSLKIWNLETGECVKDLVGGGPLIYVMGMTVGGGNSSGKGNEKATASAVWLPNGKIVTCAHDVVVWDDTTWEILWQSEPLSKEIKAVYYDEQRDIIVTASATVDGWDAKTGKKKFSQVGHDGNQIYSCFGKNEVLYTGDEKGNINAWNLENLLSGGNKIQHSNSITDLAFDFDLDRIITGSYDDSVIIWDSKGNPLKQFSRFTESTKPLGAVPNKPEQHIVVSYGKIAIFDIVRLTIIKTIELDNTLVEFDGIYWLDNERFIGYTLSYRPRIVNIKTRGITILKTLCSFTSHLELSDGLVAFTSYPTEPLDIKYDSSENEDVSADLLDIDADQAGMPKDYTSFSPLMIFDAKKMKMVQHLWHRKELEKEDATYYPNKLIEYSGNSLLVKYSDSNVFRWDLKTGESELIYEFQGKDYGMGHYIINDDMYVFDGKSEDVFQHNLNTKETSQWMAFGNDKRKVTLSPDKKYLFYRQKDTFVALNAKTKEVVFNQDFMDFRQIEFHDNKLIIGSEKGEVYVFEWG